MIKFLRKLFSRHADVETPVVTEETTAAENTKAAAIKPTRPDSNGVGEGGWYEGPVEEVWDALFDDPGEEPEIPASDEVPGDDWPANVVDNELEEEWRLEQQFQLACPCGKFVSCDECSLNGPYCDPYDAQDEEEESPYG